MNKTYVKKGLAVAVILLFFSVSVVPSTGTISIKQPTVANLDGNTLYVGGDGTGNYTKIQDAIDNASNGDTVFVYRGIYSHFFPTNPNDYHSCVSITHSISLIGEDKNDTIINGSGRYDVIKISNTENITISGFTLQNGGTPGTTLYGRGIIIWQSDNVKIYNNIVQGNKIGFYIDNPEENISIFDNIIQENDNGISIKNHPVLVKVFCNVITNNKLGIELIRAISCSVYENIISYNDVGIYLQTSSLNIIEYNQIEGNDVGISAYEGNGTTQFNNFINNNKHAYFNKDVILRKLDLINSNNQHWNGNYWDDWKGDIPRVIIGKMTIYILIWILWFPTITWVLMPIPIARLPSFQYDWHPASEPYDIGVV